MGFQECINEIISAKDLAVASAKSAEESATLLGNSVQIAQESATIAQVSANFKGDWDSNTEYTQGGSVFFDGKFYMSLKDNKNIQPDLHETYWRVITSPNVSENTSLEIGIDTRDNLSIIDLPTNPKINDSVSIYDAYGTFSDNNVTIKYNGRSLYLLKESGINVTFVYDRVGKWNIFRSNVPLSQIEVIDSYIELDGQLITSDNQRFIKDYGTRKHNMPLHAGRAISFDGSTQSVDIDINAQVQTIYHFQDGVHIYDETTQQLTTYTVNAAGQHSNYIFYDGIFTDEQKSFLELSPEKFLYREGGVIKSKILSQPEIDNIKAWLPFSDTDGNVRDLVSYVDEATGTGIYAIDGFATSQLITNLQNGLQMMNWEVDTLGVPYTTSFDKLSFDGKSYALTEWQPPIDKSWTLSFVIDLQPTVQADCWSGSGGSSLTEYVLWGTRANGTQIYLRISDQRIAIARDAGKCICTISFDADTSTGVCSWDEDDAINKVVTFDVLIPPICLGERQRATAITSTNYFENDISHFRVFDKLFTPSEIVGDLIMNKKLFPNAEIIAHKGFNTLRPEETVVAYENVIELGYDILDVDITMTADNIPICHHNEDFSLLTDGTGKAYNLTYDEIKTFHVNSPVNGKYEYERIPTFDEVVLLAKSRGKKISFEVKHIYRDRNAQMDIIFGVLNRHGMVDSVVDVNSFILDDLKYMRTLMPNTQMFFIEADPVNNPVVVSDIQSIGGKAGVVIPSAFLNDSSHNAEVKGWQDAGLIVGTWSAYSANYAMKYFNRGITHIFVNKPIFSTKVL